jgi:hypothetical protein
VIVAGQGFKDFVVGEVLTSSDVDGFLMQQAVMRFADDGARGSALGTAVGTGVLAEGMVAYLDDANYVQVYNGSAWTSAIPGIGSNVVQTVKDNVFTTTSTSLTDITGLSATITPTSLTSKVLVVAYVFTDFASDTGLGVVTLTDGSDTNLVVPAAPGSRTPGFHRPQGQGNSLGAPVTFVLLHSPNTTSPFTYKVRARSSGPTLFVNRASSETDSAANLRAVSTITAIEVAA